jgi:hypothetical protein
MATMILFMFPAGHFDDILTPGDPQYKFTVNWWSTAI